MKYILAFLFLSLTILALDIKPTEVVVVYNAESSFSKSVAQRYCECRGIPHTHMLPLFGVKRGNINREDFDGSILSSLLSQGHQRGLMWPSGPRRGSQFIRAMVLMPELPLLIREEMVDGKPAHQGQKRTEASVDSELMLLGARYPLMGMGRNPHFGKDLPTAPKEQKVLIVTRIDGPNEECIYRMINEPIEVEKNGLWGWVVVDQGGPFAEGDKLFTRVAELAREQCQPLFYETSRATLADSFPLMQQVVAYFGWYTRSANGPFSSTAPPDFRFARGAIACHLHSFNATNLYDGKTWVSALLKRGACVTAGNVAEPYLGACLDYGIFYENLLNGSQVGVAALRATPTVSWQGIILGDPLYRPFPQKARPNAQNPFVIWRNLCKTGGGLPNRMQLTIEQKMTSPNAGLFAEMFAWLCTEKKMYAQASAYFELAFGRYYSARDKARTGIMQAATAAATGNLNAAEALFAGLLRDYANSPYLPAIRKAADAIKPKPTNPPSSTQGKPAPAKK